MAEPAAVVFVGGEVHTMTTPDETAEAVAVRDGRITRVTSAYESQFVTGAETTVIDLEGRVLLPGFIDAHTHMQQHGQSLVHADLTAAESLEAALERLAEDAAPNHEWLLGFGWDESEWGEDPAPTRDDLDAVSTDRPVAAFRVDLHSVALNSVALERLRADLPEEEVQMDDGEPTGRVVESGVDVVWDAVAPDVAETRRLLRAAIEDVHAKGVTGVHDMVRQSHAPRAYRDLDAAGDLDLRVRINYWSDHLDAVEELGLRPNHGSEFVRVGAIKTFTDGSIGSQTAKLSEPFADAPDETGTWVVAPAELRELARRVSEGDRQLTAHAIGDEAVDAVLDVLEDLDDSANRHRIEHLELIDEMGIGRLADVGAVASVQPNFHGWAREGGLYEKRLGDDRRLRSNPLGLLADANVPLAFGSDGMPLDPLYGIEQAVTAPTADQRVSVTEALRAYTAGSAYAGFDEHRLGTVEVGKRADFVVLEESPWERPEHIADIDVAMTVVDGEIVYDGRD
ncbi:putative metal-dependent hydrolase with the TIM-barrel fold [Halanaeroarchaeum sp. HSR-CO]|uniref:amidohydrolase n=1 Tax=Halanaeroarchaeum sp. HSR-CO TaxID=2866382 RepID=UPI00217CF0DE|nr:amidohydrolase [Halanaeroarchaeum sp. HSR-CO]UWG48814.1 putative metal-dependent hydrolase with the TIM-barrel fold [Halanaeroarchaeum sp. HSR-CO]